MISFAFHSRMRKIVSILILSSFIFLGLLLTRHFTPFTDDPIANSAVSTIKTSGSSIADKEVIQRDSVVHPAPTERSVGSSISHKKKIQTDFAVPTEKTTGTPVTVHPAQTERSTGSCSQGLWWPRGVGPLEPRFNITPVLVEGDLCTVTQAHGGKLSPFREVINQFNQYVTTLEKVYYPTAIHEDLLKKKDNQVPIGHFQPIDFTRGHVLSAFLDSRGDEPIVKVLYLVPIKSPSLFCHAMCNGKYTSVEGTPEPLYTRISKEHCIWQQYMIHCHFQNCTPDAVSVASSTCLRPTNVLKVIKSDHESKPKKVIGACQKKIFKLTRKELPKLLNYLETFLYFGGDIVYLYGTTQIETSVMRVLDQYVSRGVLKIYDWQIPKDVTSLYTYGHYLVNMDCSYRHMGEVEHLVFMDLDEVLYPLIHNNYRDLMQYLFKPKYSAIYLERFLISPDFYKKQLNVNSKDICFQAMPKPLGRPKYMLSLQSHYVRSSVVPYSVPEYSGNNVTVLLHFRQNTACSSNAKGHGDPTQIAKVTQTHLPHILNRISRIINTVLNNTMSKP